MYSTNRLCHATQSPTTKLPAETVVLANWLPLLFCTPYYERLRIECTVVINASKCENFFCQLSTALCASLWCLFLGIAPSGDKISKIMSLICIGNGAVREVGHEFRNCDSTNGCLHANILVKYLIKAEILVTHFNYSLHDCGMKCHFLIVWLNQVIVFWWHCNTWFL